jgi:hypothetical protein
VEARPARANQAGGSRALTCGRPTGAANVDNWSGVPAADGAGGADVFVVDIEVSAGPCTYGSPGIECGADWVNPSGDDAAFIDLPSSVIPPKARAGSAAPRARPSTA